jgi:hypothetical protein
MVPGTFSGPMSMLYTIDMKCANRKKYGANTFFQKCIALKKLCFITVLLFLLAGSCVMDPEQYIAIAIQNNTNEDLTVYNGTLIFFVSTIIPKNSAYTILGVKNTSITLIGKDSKKQYGSRKFYSNDTWVVP